MTRQSCQPDDINGGFLINDKMGYGKSAETLMYIVLNSLLDVVWTDIRDSRRKGDAEEFDKTQHAPLIKPDRHKDGSTLRQTAYPKHRHPNVKAKYWLPTDTDHIWTTRYHLENHSSRRKQKRINYGYSMAVRTGY